MSKKDADYDLNNLKIKQILLIFLIPKTPSQAERELCIKKFNPKPFLENNLLKCLNPEARKGRFYTLSDKARKPLNINYADGINKDWDCIGWIISSPRQRLAVMRSVNDMKLTSEEIRARATQFNCHMDRTSIKRILKQLMEKHLVDSEILERIKFYRANSYGMKIKQELAVIAPIAPLSSAA